MSALFVVESFLELTLIICSLVLLYTVRNRYLDDFTIKAVKAKKIIGYAMVGIVISLLLNYTYLVYRYTHPVNPYDLINVDPDSFNTCTRTVK